jgi:outer membrane protein assembly factor BamB
VTKFHFAPCLPQRFALTIGIMHIADRWPRFHVVEELACSFATCWWWIGLQQMNKTSLIAIALIFSLSSALANWPQFRGPNGDGVAHRQKPPVHFGAASNVLWKIPFPAGASSPCIWGDHIFLTGLDKDKLETICVRRSDGKILWRQTAPAKQIEVYHKKEGSPAASTPATDGRQVYVYFGSFGLLCYDFAGKEKWRMELPIAQSFGGFGTGTSPIVADGLVVLNRDLITNSYILAVDTHTGMTAWKTDRPDFYTSWSSPIVWEHDATKEVVVPGALRLKAYDLKTGAERWTVRGLPAATCTSPVVGEGLLFVAAWSSGGADHPYPKFDFLLEKMDKDQNGSLSFEEASAGGMKDFFEVYDLNKDKKIARDEWTELTAIAARGKNQLLAIRPGGKGDITDSHVVWSETKGLPYVPSPLYYQGHIYTIRDGGMASCFEAKTGKTVYLQERLDAPGSYYASPVAANGNIYAASLNGVVVVFQAGETFKVTARNNLEERIMGTPAIADNKLYVRTAGHLYAFGEANH